MKAAGIIIAAIVLSGAAASSQVTGPAPAVVLGSMHGIVGARSTAMGESSVAAMGDPAAWNSNPATVTGIVGAGAHFMTGHRSGLPNRIGTDWTGGGAWLATPNVNIAIHYVKEDLGRFRQTFENGDQGETFDAYNQTATLTLGTTILGSLSVGANMKWTSERLAIAGGSEEEIGDGSGVWFDIGAIYSTRGFFKRRQLRDNVHIGASLQDIGGEISYDDMEQSYPVGEWLRVGGTYAVSIGDSAAPGVRGAISAEYKRMLNGSSLQKKSYGGVGIEVTAFEIVSVRYGEQFHPALSDDQGTSSSVYGVGINVPFKKIGINIPFAVGIDYARPPALVTDNAFDDKESQLLELRMAYTGSLFE